MVCYALAALSNDNLAVSSDDYTIKVYNIYKLILEHSQKTFKT